MDNVESRFGMDTLDFVGLELDIDGSPKMIRRLVQLEEKRITARWTVCGLWILRRSH